MRTPRTRKDMIAYLSGHFRYSTRNSWNGLTSYAKCVKIDRLEFKTHDAQMRAYDLLNTEEAFDEVRSIMNDFAREHDHLWQAGFNGRSSGYIVLYSGHREESPYKSWCRVCGQGNCKEATESDSTCGRCQSKARFNDRRFVTMTSCAGVDMHASYDEWTTQELRDRVKLVMEFDRMVDACCAAFVDFCETHDAEEYTAFRPEPAVRAVAR